MGLYSLLLGTLLVGQANAASGPNLANVTSKASGDSAAPAKGLMPRRPVTPELVAASFGISVGGTLAGRPLTLLEALGTTTDRSQQLAITHAYWRLAAAVGEYQARFGAVQRLRQLSPRAEDVSTLRAERSKATEVLRRAESEAARAQQALAETSRLSAGAPLPADLPHAGPYRTNFNEASASPSAPARNRLIHRTLPLRRQGIDLRATAVQAAEDALEAAIDGYRESSGELAVVLSCLARAVEERTAFVSEVCRYNDEIADYALSVAAAHASPGDLVTMLIFPTSQPDGVPGKIETLAAPQTLPAKRAGVAPSTGVEPATWIFPASPAQSAGVAGQPTLAPRKPTLAPKKPTSIPAEPAPLPPKPVPEERVAKRLPLADGPGASAGTTSALYPALVSASATARVKDLSAALHWNRNLPPDSGRSVELEECLRGLSAGDRRSVIDAYWIARQRLAEYQVLVGQGELIEQLVQAVLDHRQQPSGSLDMLRLQAARLAGEADRTAAQVELLQSQFELTRRVGRPLDGPWLVPSTAPHAGPYRLKLDEQRPELVQQPSMRRLSAAVPALNDALQEQAAAVVEADSARAAATTAYQLGGRGIEQLLTCVRSQTVETFAFLQTLTGYNRAIAEYALTVLPPAIPGEQLVQTLVILR
jgi:hypothetical protein